MREDCHLIFRVRAWTCLEGIHCGVFFNTKRSRMRILGFSFGGGARRFADLWVKNSNIPSLCGCNKLSIPSGIWRRKSNQAGRESALGRLLQSLAGQLSVSSPCSWRFHSSSRFLSGPSPWQVEEFLWLLDGRWVEAGRFYIFQRRQKTGICGEKDGSRCFNSANGFFYGYPDGPGRG